MLRYSFGFGGSLICSWECRDDTVSGDLICVLLALMASLCAGAPFALKAA